MGHLGGPGGSLFVLFCRLPSIMPLVYDLGDESYKKKD